MVSPLSTNDFDHVAALSLPQINKALHALWITHPELQKLSVNNSLGIFEAKVKSLEIGTVGKTASTCCHLLIHLENGEFHLGQPDSPTYKFTSWTLRWHVDFDLYKLNSKMSDDIRNRFLQSDDYSGSSLLSLLTLVDLGYFDVDTKLDSLNDHGWETQWVRSLAWALSEHAACLKDGGSHHLFDFKSLDNNGPKATTQVGTQTATTSVTNELQLLLLPSEDKIYEHHIFFYLEVVKNRAPMSVEEAISFDFPTWAVNALNKLSNQPWLGKYGDGTMTVDSSRFFGGYVMERSRFVFGQVMAILNANFHIALFDGAPPPSPCEWLLPNRPLGEDWNAWEPSGLTTWDWRSWDQTVSPNRYTFKWQASNDLKDYDEESSLSGSLELLPGTNQIKCLISGFASRDMDDDCLRRIDIWIELLISMHSMSDDDGVIKFDVILMDLATTGKITRSRSQLWPIHNMKENDPELTRRLEEQMKEYIPQQIQNLRDRWKVSLNFDQSYGFPGRKLLEMTYTPRFNEKGNFSINIRRKHSS